MRLLFLSMEYPPDTARGGIGSYVACVAPLMASAGHDVHVISCAPGQTVRDYMDKGVHIHRRPRRHLPGLAHLTYGGARIEAAISCWLETRRLSLSFDVLETPDWLAEGLVLSMETDQPTVSHLHGPVHIIRQTNFLPLNYDARLGDWLERTAVRRSDICACLAPHMAQDLLRSGWVGAREIRVIPFPLDLAVWKAIPPVDKTRPMVLVVGRIERRKAQELVIEAAARLSSIIPDLEVALIGRSGGTRDGLPYVDWITHLAKERGVRCTVPGQVRRDELPAWYGRSRVVVVPSWYEGLCIAALEGMAAGRPLICTQKVGAAELVRGTAAGCVIDPGNIDALTDALAGYLRDADAAALAGGRAREIVSTYSDLAGVIRSYEDLYAAAIAVRKSRLRGHH